jgi:outer membrane protein assembly factor BamB
MTSRGDRRSRTERRVRLAVLAVLLSGALVAATVAWDWGHVVYAVGVAGVACGVIWLVATFVHSTLRRVVTCAVAAAVVVVAAVLAVTGLPSTEQTWDAAGGEGLLGDSSARAGDLVIAGGTARDVRTGEVVWQHDGDDARPALVEDELVVITTSDSTVAVDPVTGRELWRSPVSGLGVAHDDDRLVLATTAPDDSVEAVALDLATGKTAWRRAGRPVMECQLGPADRLAPARRQSHVLLVDEEGDNRAQLLALTDGEPTIKAVDCLVSARVVDEVLLEGVAGEVSGRSVADGHQLWSVPSSEPWNVLGSGPTVFTPMGSGLTAVEVSSGRATQVEPPSGTPEVSPGVGQVYRAPEVWAPVEVEGRPAMWNPGTGRVVDVPGADAVHTVNVNESSGWVAIDGTTRDITGAEHDRCWALSQDGKLSGPFDGSSCTAYQGLLETDDAVYPLS